MKDVEFKAATDALSALKRLTDEFQFNARAFENAQRQAAIISQSIADEGGALSIARDDAIDLASHAAGLRNALVYLRGEFNALVNWLDENADIIREYASARENNDGADAELNISAQSVEYTASPRE